MAITQQSTADQAGLLQLIFRQQNMESRENCAKKFTPEQSRRFDAALRERLGGSGLEELFPVTTGVAR